LYPALNRMLVKGWLASEWGARASQFVMRTA
jgi:DNA-binding PadR family transcriptional regulator